MCLVCSLSNTQKGAWSTFIFYFVRPCAARNLPGFGIGGPVIFYKIVRKAPRRKPDFLRIF